MLGRERHYSNRRGACLGGGYIDEVKIAYSHGLSDVMWNAAMIDVTVCRRFGFVSVCNICPPTSLLFLCMCVCVLFFARRGRRGEAFRCVEDEGEMEGRRIGK